MREASVRRSRTRSGGRAGSAEPPRQKRRVLSSTTKYARQARVPGFRSRQAAEQSAPAVSSQAEPAQPRLLGARAPAPGARARRARRPPAQPGGGRRRLWQDHAADLVRALDRKARRLVLADAVGRRSDDLQPLP